MALDSNNKTPVFVYTFLIPASAIDGNGHVNNVAYVQWMQDVAIKHWLHLCGEELAHHDDTTWVVRSHRIDYLSPAFEGEEIEITTWIETVGRVRSLRKYSFRRTSDDKQLARGETDWVFVDAKTFRPRAITEKVRNCFPGDLA